MSCFCPAFVVRGDDVALFQFFNKLLDGPLERGWTRGSEIETCRSEYQSFVREQRPLERLSTRSHPYVRDVLCFCSEQAGFRARQHLYKVCIVSNHACCFAFLRVVCFPQETMIFQVFQLTALVIRGPATRSEKFIVSLDRVAIKEEDVRGVLLCVQDFVRCAHFTPRIFFSESGLTTLSDSVAIIHSITSSPACARGVLWRQHAQVNS